MKLLPPLIIATIALLPGRAAFGQTKPPETRSASPAAKPGAVGFVLEKQGEEFEVKALAPGTPAAAQQKIQPGDYLVSVSQGGGPAVPVRGKDMAAVTALIRGPEGSTVGISAVHPGEDEGRAKMRQLVRAPIELIASASDSALKPGEAAPELTGVFWIKGEPVTKFARDKVYLVECWATWCGPCVANIPHLEVLHRKFQDRGLVVIGQNIWEEDSAKVRKFVEMRGDKMSYRVALDAYSGAQKVKGQMPKGTMSETWIRPGRGGSYGIPEAFFVGKDGKIVWSGHPAKLTDAMIETTLAKPAGS